MERQFAVVEREAFAGEGPALPVVLETIARAKEQLEAARTTRATLGEAVEFAEPGGSDRTTIREKYERGYRTRVIGAG